MFQQRTYNTLPEISKSQTIRLVDVFFIAPFMAYIGYKAQGISSTERVVLYGLAGATLIFNARNYLATQEEIDE